jgi:hypothetical protein
MSGLFFEVGAGAASNIYPEPEPHKDNAAPQHFSLPLDVIVDDLTRDQDMWHSHLEISFTRL